MAALGLEWMSWFVSLLPLPWECQAVGMLGSGNAGQWSLGSLAVPSAGTELAESWGPLEQAVPDTSHTGLRVESTI